MNTLDMNDFRITPVSGAIGAAGHTGAAPLMNPLGPLALLPGTWKGRGFNQIWRPFRPGAGDPPTQDRFLEFNETEEVLQFVEIPGDIPNRGLLQADITLHGMTYLQKVNDAHVLNNGKPAGIHIEPGIWVSVPGTDNPANEGTVARMANIPHGTSLLAQGKAITVAGGPIINPVDITPFRIGNPAIKVPFPESNLSIGSPFRTPAGDIPHVTQAMVDNPNSVLTDAIAGRTIKNTTVLIISTSIPNTAPLAPPPPSTGGGTSNISFLLGDPASGVNANANAAQMTAIFWIEELVRDDDHEGHDTRFLLQYTQTVMLNFKGLSWPHVSVATLVKQGH